MVRNKLLNTPNLDMYIFHFHINGLHGIQGNIKIRGIGRNYILQRDHIIGSNTIPGS
jgi:hypothetical protein